MTLRCENCGSDDIARCERDDSAEYEYICNVCDMIQRPQIQPIDVYAELAERIEKLEKRLESDENVTVTLTRKEGLEVLKAFLETGDDKGTIVITHVESKNEG